jgi:DNA (cytosine-5)-methyltransferase 3A
MGLNVLSLFGGMEVFRQAFKELNIEIDNYYCSEIYNQAIKIANKNHNDIINLGDIKNINNDVLKKLPKIDIVGFGFPCRNLSRTVINNKNHNQGLDGKHSSLFYEAIRILYWLKENNNKDIFFLCENVESMKKEDKEIITEYLGVEPIMIDAALFSAQDRKRYFWTNINEGVFDLPDSCELVLEDIIEDASDVPDKYWYDKTFDFHGYDKKVCATVHVNGHDILKRVNNPKFKSATLTSCRGGNTQKKVFQNNKPRKLMPIEYERLQSLPDKYTEGVSDSARYNMLGDGWNLEVIKFILKCIKD